MPYYATKNMFVDLVKTTRIFWVTVHQGGRGTFWTSQVGQLCKRKWSNLTIAESDTPPKFNSKSPWKMDGKGRWGNPFGSKPIFRGELLNFWGVDVLRSCPFGGWKKRSPEAKLVFYDCSLGKLQNEQLQEDLEGKSVISIWNVCIFLTFASKDKPAECDYSLFFFGWALSLSGHPHEIPGPTTNQIFWQGGRTHPNGHKEIVRDGITIRFIQNSGENHGFSKPCEAIERFQEISNRTYPTDP